ncbi:MAG: glycosyltransferase family 39 protein [candidate division KSB1 bacterium]|nr:glycosyltransferase family 39 protein [candidate division KSB1 bacterium]
MRRIVDLLLRDRVLLLICAFGLLARVTFVATLEPRLYWPIDEGAYDHLAKALASGKGYVTPEGEFTAYRPVGYPAFLALLYSVFGPNLVVVRLVQSLLTTALVCVVYLLGRHLFTKEVARVAAGMCALYPYYIYISGVLYSEALSVLLMACGVYLFIAACERPATAKFVIVGALLGALVLTRPNTVAAFPFFLAWYIWVPGVRRRVPVWMPGVAMAVAVLLILPWMARNQVRLGAFTLATNGGRNFWLGNNPGATADTGNEVPLTPELTAKLEGARSEVERDRVYYASGLQFIRRQPSRFLGLTASKAIAFWRLYPVPSSGFKQHEGFSKLASIVTYGPILVLAIVGLAVSWANAPERNLAFLCLFVCFNVAHAVYISIVRLRLPLDLFLMTFAAYAVTRAREWCAQLTCGKREKSVGRVEER